MEPVDKSNVNQIILSSLSSGEKYGYEIIDYAESCGYLLKQPTLYGALKKLEDIGSITSYWKDSNLGGRRHYFRISDYGKKHLDMILKNSDVSALESSTVTPVSKKKKENQESNIFQTNIFENKISNAISPADFSADYIKDDFEKKSNINFNNLASEQPKDSCFENLEIKKLINSKQCDETVNQNHSSVNNNSNQNSILIEKNKLEKSIESAPILESKEHDEATFNIFQEIDLVKKNVSYSNNKQKNDNASRLFSPFINEEQINLDINDKKYHKDYIHEEDNNFIQKDSVKTDCSVCLSEHENREIISNDSKFITERIDESSYLDPVAVSFANSDNQIKPTFIDTDSKVDQIIKNAKNVEYKNPINDLYRTATTRTDDFDYNMRINASLISNVFKRQYISKNETPNHGLRVINFSKFSLLKFIFSLIYITIVSTSLFLLSFLKFSCSKLSIVYIIPLLIIVLIYCSKLFNKKRNRLKLFYNYTNSSHKLFFRTLFFIFISLAIFLINLACGLSLNNFTSYIPFFIFPIFISLLVPLLSLFEFISKKSKFVQE